MSSLAPHVGRETEVRALGKVWKIGRMDLDVLEKFIDWVKPQLGDPFDGLEKLVEKLPPAEAMALIREAKARKDEPLDWDSEIVQKFRNTKRGQLVSLWHLLQVNHPELTLSEAFQIGLEVGAERLEQAVADANGKTPAPPKP